MREIEAPFAAGLDRLLARGSAAREFRTGLDPMFVHISVVALAYFYLGNARTLSLFFGTDLSADEMRTRWRAHMIDAVTRIVATPPG